MAFRRGSNQESQLKLQICSSPLVIVTQEVSGKVSHGCWVFRSDTTECQGFARKWPHATFVASINANNSFVLRDVGWTQTYSFPESPLTCFTASGQEQAPPAPLNYLKCCTKGPWITPCFLKSSLIPIMALASVVKLWPCKLCTQICMSLQSHGT